MLLCTGEMSTDEVTFAAILIEQGDGATGYRLISGTQQNLTKCVALIGEKLLLQTYVYLILRSNVAMECVVVFTVTIRIIVSFNLRMHMNVVFVFTHTHLHLKFVHILVDA